MKYEGLTNKIIGCAIKKNQEIMVENQAIKPILKIKVETIFKELGYAIEL